MKSQFLLLILFMVFSCSQQKTEKAEITDLITSQEEKVESQIEQVEEGKPDTSVDTLGTNEFWSNQNITGASLYCYYPESNYEISQLILDENSVLNPTVIDSLTIDLDRFDLELLISAITTETNYMEDEVADCFEPHHGIVLKSRNEIVGHISICFECNQYRIKPNNIQYIPIMIFKKICAKYRFPIGRKTIGKLYHHK